MTGCPTIVQGVHPFCNHKDCPTSAAVLNLTSILDVNCEHCLVESGFKCKHLHIRGLMYRLTSSKKVFPYSFAPRRVYALLQMDYMLMYDMDCESCLGQCMSKRACHHGENMKLYFKIFDLSLEIMHTEGMFDASDSDEEHFSIFLRFSAAAELSLIVGS